MYSMYKIVAAPSDKDRLEKIVRNLSPELSDAVFSPVYDEDDEILEYVLSGFLPEEVIEMLGDEKKLTKRLKEKGDSDSETKNRAILRRLKLERHEKGKGFKRDKERRFMRTRAERRGG